MKFVTPVLLLLVFIALVVLIIRLEKYYREFQPVLKSVEQFKIPDFLQG
jgi:uncharacterized protein YoxC